MNAITTTVTLVIDAVNGAVAPHRFSLLALAFALVWGYNMVAPAFRGGRK